MTNNVALLSKYDEAENALMGLYRRLALASTCNYEATALVALSLMELQKAGKELGLR